MTHFSSFERPAALRISDVCKASGLGRTTIFAAIKSGALVARKYGRRTLVLQADLDDFLQQLPRALEARGHDQQPNS